MSSSREREHQMHRVTVTTKGRLRGGTQRLKSPLQEYYRQFISSKLKDMGMIKTHNNFSFEGVAVVEGFDVDLTPAFE
jgi:hypothetical protein